MESRVLLYQIQLLKLQISDLPVGYISKKTIHGKVRYYHQWTDNGKLVSKYLKEGELEPLQERIEKRKELQATLSELEKLFAKTELSRRMKQEEKFNTNILVGGALISMVRGVEKWKRRFCYSQLEKYLRSDETDRVCILYGLRRTGKTTMMRQAIADMTSEQLSKTAYIKIKKTDDLDKLGKDLMKLFENGFRYVFIDEVTLLEDFIDCASLLSDIYACMGMKIVLSGTDSLGFWMATHQELYDRARMIHTTYIPYAEHSYLLGINSIDDYMRYGGTLRAGELDFEDDSINAYEATFRDNEVTRQYIDTAIAKNIQHSLACCEGGKYFHHLIELYEEDELTGAINRVIEDMNHRFIRSVFTKDFISNDLHMTAKNMRSCQINIMELIDEARITRKLMGILDIHNDERNNVSISNSHIAEIKEYLRALELIAEYQVVRAEAEAEPLNNIVFTQPGLRYCQAEALAYLLFQDELANENMISIYSVIAERILEEVRGRMLEEIVLLETIKASRKNHAVFKLQFAVGEYDMVIFDKTTGCCDIYEIKHSDQIVPQQYRFLMDEELNQKTEKRVAPIRNRIVLYRGEDVKLENGVLYRNVEKYLKNLQRK